MNVKKQMETIAKKLNAVGRQARVWTGGEKCRCYINGFGKDIKAWIENYDVECGLTSTEEAVGYSVELFHGCRVRVFTNAENVSGKWAVNRRKQIMHTIMHRLHDAEVVPVTPCENWADVILS